MRSKVLLIILISCYLLTNATYGFQLTHEVTSKDTKYSGVTNIHDTGRKKREIESFDNEDYPSAVDAAEQNEPGFWDRVVKVALKLFNKFIEWLNSS